MLTMLATFLQLMLPSAQNLVYVVSVHLHFVFPCTTQHGSAECKDPILPE